MTTNPYAVKRFPHWGHGVWAIITFLTAGIAAPLWLLNVIIYRLAVSGHNFNVRTVERKMEDAKRAVYAEEVEAYADELAKRRADAGI